MSCLFFRRGRQCRLSFVSNRPANWVIAALLIFQLAIGLQWQTAQAAVAPPERGMNGMGAGQCPDHANKHDCCRSLGCQCHCAQSPGMQDLTRPRADLSSTLQLPVLAARRPVARSNELFRPPIV
jgi:hypothetical protein